MRKVILAVAVVACASLMTPVASTAATKPTEQELLILKKKKAEAARKAEAKKLQAKKKLAEKKKADEKKMAEARRRADARKKETRKRDCGDFLGCLFGKKKNPNVRPASLADDEGFAGDYATAENVSWDGSGKYAAGSIVVRTPERALYLVLGEGKARRYKVGVGREGFQWSGNSRIVNKAEWPTWRPPQAMIEREAAKGHYLPDVMEGGPDNPLGARALYIGGTMYRIHGTNNAASIGGAVSSGCIRMMNTDVIDLYKRVNVGARVYVYQ